MANVHLGAKFEQYVKERVESGDYTSVSELVRDALRLKMRVDASDQAKLESLRRDVELGWQQAERGDFADYSLDETLNRLDTEMESR